MNMMMDLADIFPMIVRAVVVVVVIVHIVIVVVAIDHLADFTVISPRLGFRSLHTSSRLTMTLSLSLSLQDVPVPAGVVVHLSHETGMILHLHPGPINRTCIRNRIRIRICRRPTLNLSEISGLPSVELGPPEDDQAIRPTRSPNA